VVQASLLSPSEPITGASAPAPVATRETLGAHILAEIARCNGPQLPCYSSTQILDGFWARFGPGAPITILRFQAHHDPFFALPLRDEAEACQGTSDR
jgi:hypothetical protein